MRIGDVVKVAVVSVLIVGCGAPARPVDPMQIKREQAAEALTAMLDDDSEFARVLALESLGKMGVVALDPVLARMELAEGVEVGELCGVLGSIGEDAVPAVQIIEQKMVGSAEYATQKMCVEALASIQGATLSPEQAPDGLPVPEVQELVPDDNDLGDLTMDDYDEILALTRVEECCVAYSALEALASIGPPPDDAIQQLLLLTTSEDDQLARGAVSALAAGGEASVPFFLAMLERDDPHMQELGYTGLAEVGPAASEAVLPMLAYMCEQDGFDLMLAIDGFIAVYAPTMEGFDTYLEMAFGGGEIGMSGHLGLFHLIRETSKEISEPGQPIVPDELMQKLQPRLSYFIEMLSTDHNEIRVISSLILGFIGPPSVGAFDALISNLSDDDPDVRAFAAAALGLILGLRSPSFSPTNSTG